MAPATVIFRKRRAELAGEVMDAEIGPVGAELLGGDGKLDRLQKRVRRRPRLRLRRRVTPSRSACVGRAREMGPIAF